jgi:REP element-mobilizing transposase RayT
MLSVGHAYRRHLPHYQNLGRTYFVTFATKDRWVLPPEARNIALRHVVFEHEWHVFLHVAVVMPDHVHFIGTPFHDSPLAKINKGIKGTSSRKINQLLSRAGAVWRDEPFDHQIRRDESLQEKIEYVCQNPVRKGLVSTPDEYPWLWREWVDRQPPSAADGLRTRPT